MKPYLVKFHLYAEDESEVQDLQCALYDLVSGYYGEGIYVTAPKLAQALRRFGTNALIKQYLK